MNRRDSQNAPRIGLIHWTFPPTTGGVESHLWDLARSLAAEDCAVTVITGEPSPVASACWETDSSPLLSLEHIRSGSLQPDAYTVRLRDFLHAAIIGRGLDIVHGHNLHHFHPQPALVLEDLRTQYGLKLFHTFHETWPDILESTPVYRRWDGNFAVSSFVQEQCLCLLGFRPQLLRLGVDLDRFRCRRAKGPGKAVATVLHPARLLPWKGVHLSVAMLARLRDQGIDARLIITDTQRIADWNRELESYRRQILKLISDLGLDGRVEFRSVAYADMPSIYEEADVVIYPTVGDEPYGLVPLEAMASGRAVVASRSGGITETVVDDITGFLVEKGDVDTLADRVATLLLVPELAQQLGAAGRRRVEQEFDGHRYTSALLALYAKARRERDNTVSLRPE